MRKALLVSAAVLGVLVGAVAIAGFIRFNFTNGGDVVSDRKSSPEISDLTITIDTQECAVNDGGSYRASNALLLGDRIEPRAVEFTDGRFVYTYAERKPGDSMSERGTVEKSVTVTIDHSTGAISAS